MKLWVLRMSNVDYFPMGAPIKEFPRLDIKYKQLLQEYYDAEFEDNKEKIDTLRQQLDILELRMQLGEEYEIPF